MKTNILKWLGGAVILLALMLLPWSGSQPSAQTTLNTTTLDAAITDATATTVTLASGTTVAAGQVLFVDRELMRIQSAVGSSTTNWNVTRGFDGTASALHGNGARVYTGARDRFYRRDVSGTCVAADDLFTPHINTTSGRIWECEAGYWMEWKTDQVAVRDYTVRDSFDNGHTVLQDDGTAKSLTDAEVNLVYGSPLGAITYREELGKTVSSWITINGYLDISGDGTDDEGVEIVVGNGTDPTLNQFFEAGTQGACVAAAFSIADASGSDNLQIGFRQNEAFQDLALYTGYTVWNSVGFNTTDGSIISSQEVSETTDTDDSGVNWADAETRALKVCVSKAGVPTAYYSNAYTSSQVLTDRPVYNAIAMTETGSTLTAGTGMVPFITFLHRADVSENTRILWVELTKIP